MTAPVDHHVEVGSGLSLAVRSWTGHEPVAFLLLHGLASNLRMWDGVALRLAAGGYPVHAVDLRGHGGSSKPDSGYETSAVLDDVSALLTELDLDGPVVAGQSWGGNLAVGLGARHPTRLRAVVGVDGGAIDLQGRWPQWEECARRLAPPQLAGMAWRDLERRIRRTTDGWPETGVQGVLSCFERRPDGTAAPWLTFDRHLLVLRGLWETRPQADWRGADLPVLLLAAVGSGAVRASYDEALATLPHGRLTPVEGPHDLHAALPDAVSALLLDAAG